MKSIELLDLYAGRGGIVSTTLSSKGGIMFCEGIECDDCPVDHECDKVSYLLPKGVPEDEFEKWKSRHPEHFI